jgi:hypothetical protein
MSTRVGVLGIIVDDFKHNLWVDNAFNLINITFSGMYESLDDFLWDTSIEATNLLLPSLDLGPNTQYSNETIEALKHLVLAKIIYKTNLSLSMIASNYGR